MIFGNRTGVKLDAHSKGGHYAPWQRYKLSNKISMWDKSSNGCSTAVSIIVRNVVWQTLNKKVTWSCITIKWTYIDQLVQSLHFNESEKDDVPVLLPQLRSLALNYDDHSVSHPDMIESRWRIPVRVPYPGKMKVSPQSPRLKAASLASCGLYAMSVDPTVLNCLREMKSEDFEVENYHHCGSWDRRLIWKGQY